MAIALVTTPGCYQAHERDVDAGPVDAFAPDVPDMGPCARPLPCMCGSLASPGTCTGIYLRCCPITGPLAPPSLPAWRLRAPVRRSMKGAPKREVERALADRYGAHVRDDAVWMDAAVHAS